MKWSIATTIGILAVGFYFVRQNQRQLDELHSKHTAIKVEQVPEVNPSPGKPKEKPKIAPKAPMIEVSAVIAVAKESIESRAQGRMKTEAERQHESALREQLKAFDPSQVEEFCARILSCAELPPNEKGWWIGCALAVLGQTDPDKALNLLAIHVGGPMESSVNGWATGIFSQIAMKNPDQAFAKFEEFASKFPGIDPRVVTPQLLFQISRIDLNAAFRLMETKLEPLGFERVDNALGTIVMSCETEDQCLSLVSYMQGFLNRCKDSNTCAKIRQTVLSSVAHRLAKNGFDSTEQWMRHANLSREQYLQMGFSAAVNCNGKDNGKWLEWYGREQPYPSTSGEKQRMEWCRKTRSIAFQWLVRDTQSFGAWLDTQPPSTVKNMCIVEFAHQIAEDHPDTAAGWVQKIDNEEDRKFMFNEVYKKANFKSSEEEEVFAKQHGIK